MRLPVLAVLALILSAPRTFAAPAATPADQKLMADFTAAIKTNDVAAARKLVALPNFSPLMTASPQQDYDYNLLERTILGERLAIARLMMASAGWKKTKWTPQTTARPLINAAFFSSMFPILQEMSRQPAFDLNTPAAANGEFPLKSAANSDNMVALKWLTAQPKIKLTARNTAGENALFYAGDKATVYLLSLKKFDLNARNAEDMTVLHQAVSENDIDKVRALIAAPTLNPNLKDSNGATPLDIALSQSVEISELLISNRKVKATAAQRKAFKTIKTSGLNRAG